ncbi:spore germination protein [Clostridium sp. WILCCON 0269]|uniref:Spore germination protein n=1 Tax=Candidatus Clostridium eludens TaxID=3381663 RepID=A0ABW8SFY1_9CLOT
MELDYKIDSILELCGSSQQIIVRRFAIGKENPVDAALVYKDGLVNQDIINRDILNPLMHTVNEDISKIQLINEEVCNKYISMSKISIQTDINMVVKDIRRGKTAILIYKTDNFIIADTMGGEHRNISEPLDEVGIRGPKNGFIENIQINLSLIKEGLKDKNLVIENLIVGRRSQRDVALIYIEDIADKDLIEDIRNRISSVDVDAITSMGMLEQYIENYPYSIFPQGYASQRPDVVQQNLTEGRIALLLDGTPFALTVPALFIEFFQAGEDYSQRTIISNLNRMIRVFGTLIVITLPSIYLALIRYNAELIPVKFVIPIIQSRRGIALPPLLEILSMQVVVELLREGGLRLPSKIGQTLSVVGGFIIGSAALQANLVSPATLVIVGVATIGTFIIPSYDMSISIRLISFPFLFLTNFLGAFGLIAGWYFVFVHLLSLDSFGVPYLSLDKYNDLKDMFIRIPLWEMNKRPEGIPNNDPIRQTDFRNKFWGKKDEKGSK